MMRILFMLFIAVPLIELYVLIEVGGGIGGLSTVVLCLFTAALGGLIIRIQGMQTLIQARQSMANMQQGKLAEHSAHGAMLVLAGVLLFFPGLITDAVGFILLVPAVRRMLMPRRIIKAAEFDQRKSQRYPEVDVIDVEVIKKD